jgi:hypothetical protein
MKNDVAQALSRAKFWEADRRQFADKLLILLVAHKDSNLGPAD